MAVIPRSRFVSESQPATRGWVTQNHSTFSRTRRLNDLETHRHVFGWVLGRLVDRGLLKGRTVGVDATTLEANAAMRSIVRRDTGASHDEFLTELARQSGIETPNPGGFGAGGSDAQEQDLQRGLGQHVGCGCTHYQVVSTR